MTTQIEIDLASDRAVEETAADGSPLWWKIQTLVNQTTRLFVKKLSRNDTSWADDTGKHQAGIYIPSPVREEGFFPALVATNPKKPHIFFASCKVLWPQTGEITESTMRHYSNKGPETHFTRFPKALFRDLTPASLLVCGHFKDPLAAAPYWIVVLDSASVEAELLEARLDLQSDFHFRVFDSALFEHTPELEKDETKAFIEELQFAIKHGTLSELLAQHAIIPTPAVIAERARAEWLRKKGERNFDPWSITCPGDAIMEISRDIEYRIYRQYELRRRATELVTLLHGRDDLATAVVEGFAKIDSVFLSASQQRKSRAGGSFELHIEASLNAGQIRHVAQAVTGGRRPDFVMPDVRSLRSSTRDYSDALVLAAKTTLRERWKQVSSERLKCDLFLATVDDRVARSSIQELACSGIKLVVPESLKNSKETHYQAQANVLSFREFFDDEVKKRRPFLLAGTHW